MIECEELKMYSDYKSPYAWLAFDPAFALEARFAVKVRWIPFQLRIKGSGQRSVYSEYKVKYSYMDARRTANERGDKKIIRGPLKIYDTAPSLIGGLFGLTVQPLIGALMVLAGMALSICSAAELVQERSVEDSISPGK